MAVYHGLETVAERPPRPTGVGRRRLVSRSAFYARHETTVRSLAVVTAVSRRSQSDLLDQRGWVRWSRSAFNTRHETTRGHYPRHHGLETVASDLLTNGGGSDGRGARSTRVGPPEVTPRHHGLETVAERPPRPTGAQSDLLDQRVSQSDLLDHGGAGRPSRDHGVPASSGRPVTARRAALHRRIVWPRLVDERDVEPGALTFAVRDEGSTVGRSRRAADGHEAELPGRSTRHRGRGYRHPGRTAPRGPRLRHPGVRRVWAEIDPRNVAALRVATRSGCAGRACVVSSRDGRPRRLHGDGDLCPPRH